MNGWPPLILQKHCYYKEIMSKRRPLTKNLDAVFGIGMEADSSSSSRRRGNSSYNNITWRLGGCCLLHRLLFLLLLRRAGVDGHLFLDSSDVLPPWWRCSRTGGFLFALAAAATMMGGGLIFGYFLNGYLDIMAFPRDKNNTTLSRKGTGIKPRSSQCLDPHLPHKARMVNLL